MATLTLDDKPWWVGLIVGVVLLGAILYAAQAYLIKPIDDEIATNDAKSLIITNTIGIQDFAMQVGTNRLDQAQLTLGLEMNVENLKTLTVDKYDLSVQQRNQPLVKGSGSARYDFAKSDLNLQVNAELALPAS